MVGRADDVVRLSRARAQLLHRPDDRPEIADLVRRMPAVQAQDTAAAALALRARARGITTAMVDAARDDRSIVRAWGPRGTIHYVAADDLPWLLPLVGPPYENRSLRRLRQEGVTGPYDAVVPALAGRGPLTREELGERLRVLGVVAAGQGIVHLATLAACRGAVLLGPDRGGGPTYVHAADWLGREIAFEPDRDRALAELARRYLRSHAPAGPEDLAAWSGLPLGECRRAWRLADLGDPGPTGAAGGADGSDGSDGSNGPEGSDGSEGGAEGRPGVRLLPAFDEYLLGWRDRGPVLPARHAARVHPGGGILRATVTEDGLVTGTWRRPGGRVEIDPFDPPGPDASAEIADIARFTTAP
ncbi:winged helix DNA-binding domain-containing protein [Bailinhaonella thermotolerans]|uniref:Winged helix DNA-binding domain-containing protein n=1 Tax=Bailinhaonella thermotolerans TaxID=1070861 RepID=A0A3A4AW45_9ACTN|nr:winged helix DNA-binding domain-containing protein [Bailinhaonella thermotolerans]RJL34105.1 winged helix DNA-binding domain-containing protein [Bailinhaonella thermotolerans]